MMIHHVSKFKSLSAVANELIVNSSSRGKLKY